MRCVACDHPISTTARFCPQCGARQPMDGDTARSPVPFELPADSSVELTAPASDVGSAAQTIVTASSMDSAGGPPTPSRFLPAGLVLGEQYVIEAVVGEGGMGVVYRARDRALDRTVAVKCLHLNLMGDPEVRRRFVREARVMTRWSHPHIAAVYDFVQTDQVLGLVMEYLEGETLLAHLKRWRGGLPLAELGALMGPVLDAMHTAHLEGVVHRDLKPDNILLVQRDGRWVPKVVDFGIAKILEGTAYTVSGALLGTWRYIAPEQARNPQLVDHRADLYALGVTLFQLVEGRLPFEHDNPYALLMDHVNTPAPPVTRPGVPPGLSALIAQCLSKDPAARPSSAVEVAQRLSAAVTPSAPPEARPEPVGRIGDDGVDLVPITGGVFLMGRDRREVWLDPFAIDRFPVTNRQFARFLEATGYRPARPQRFLAHWRSGRCPSDRLEHPVVYVSWHDARAYAAWVGRRLPSEAQWEKAARGTDGRKYPWGRTSPTAAHARFGGRGSGQGVSTCPVGAHPTGASPYGVRELAGNVWEWCEDADDPAFYEHGPPRNPLRRGPPDRDMSVVRGGSWAFSTRELRTFARRAFPPDTRLDGVGFRCAL